MAATLTKTLKGGNFDGIFTEVPHAETLGLRNPEALRLFHLDVVNYAFNTAGLHKFLSRNIGQYVFSRAKLEKYRVDDDLESVAYDALSLMHQNGSPDEKGTGNELGEILLYAFLEEKLGAPKIMSKVELNTTGKQYSSKCDSIHLLPFEDSYGFPYYQMVFGTSSIIGDLKDAIDCAFDRIVQIESGSGNEIQMIESTALDHIFNEETSKTLLNILIPSKENNATYDSAYGVSMVAILRDYMAVRAGSSSDYLFCNEFGDFLSENALRLAIVKYNNTRGVERTSLHAFRHTFARKYLVDCGGDAFSLQRLMGHSTLKMTRHYCNLFNDDIIENHEQRSPLAQLTKSKRQAIKK